MTETAFPVNDLLRRRLQTGLTVLSLTTCVASTLFLLMFSGQIGYGIAAVSRNTLTSGISAVFAQFLTFTGALIFVVGAVIVSFIVFLMMGQRTKDFGLMKATGCPNSLVFGYFLTELLGITFVGCLLGVVAGLVTDYAIINLPVLNVYNSAPNFWFIPLVFAVYFIFALVFGAKPLFDAARMTPLRALSSVQYFGLGKGPSLKPLSPTGLTFRIASRSLFRRKSATLRIVIFLSAVFLLLTVSVAGGIIANDTSASWIQRAVGKNVVLVADRSLANQYVQLLLTFSGNRADSNFNYSNPALSISNDTIQQLSQVSGVKIVDERLILESTVEELPGFMIDPSTLSTITIGDHRSCESLIVGVTGGETISEPLTTGFFINATSDSSAVVGDSIANAIYRTFREPFKPTILGDPLYESARVYNYTFEISGKCLDPLNSGNVTYVSLQQLEQISDISAPNLILVQISDAASYDSTIEQMQAIVAATNSNIAITNLTLATKTNLNFLASLWGVIMLLPAFALAAAGLCLVSFLMISIEEQHQEFAILRATGAKPSTVIMVLAAQSLTVLLSSFVVGASLGIIATLIVLVSQPVVTGFSVLVICGWLLATLLGMFLVSLYPAVKFSRKSLPAIMS